MISDITASIGMACLGTGLVPGLGIIRCCNILLQRILLPRFSNVVKSKESTQSKPRKDKHHRKVAYTASKLHTINHSMFTLRKQLENTKMANYYYSKMPMVGDCVPQPKMLWYPVGVPLSYHLI